MSKSMKIANIDREILHIFWTTWEISMKLSGELWLMIILKFTDKQGFTLSLEDTFFEKPRKEKQDFTLSLEYTTRGVGGGREDSNV